MKKKQQTFVLWAGIIGAALVIGAGCSKPPSQPAVAASADRYLVWNLGSEPKSWDPTTNSESIADYLATQLFEGLTYITADGIGPGVAERWDISPDGKTYTFYLRKNAKWSDGSPVTARDFEYSWKRICDPQVASDALQGMTDYVVGAQEFFDGVGTADGVKAAAVDDYTFRVELKNVAPYFPSLIANDIYMPVKKDVVDAVGEGWEKSPATCIGNGPFKLTEYQIGSHFLLEKNEHYWGADQVKLKGLRVLFIGDENTSLQGYQAGEIDVTELLPADEIPRLVAEDPNAVSAPDTGFIYLFFNCDKPPLNDVRVRRAITYAIDRKTIVEQVTKAGEIPATGAFAPTAEKTDGSSFRTLDANGYPLPEYGIDPYKAKVPEAKALLAEAGYPDGTGFPSVEILYNTSSKWKAVTEAVQQMLKDNLNINVTLRNVESSVYWDIMGEGKYEIGRGGWTNNPFNPSGLIKQFHSQNGNNSAQWRWQPYAGAPWDTALNPDNLAFDQAFELALTLQGAESDAAWVLAEQALMAGLPMAPLYYPVMTYVVNSQKTRGAEKSPSLRWIFKHAEVIQ
ncbi:MAG: peptide ABC transporter substrate-binding protein [Treponema sp.]|jgi:oligopeptide transport system substrate-binding protein|nr:peptide ABC transporter substrate-binding protein [Treponema sp.]